MLVLSRKVGEEIVIAGNIRVRVVLLRGNRVQLAIAAPDSVSVHREEVFRRRAEFILPSETPLISVAAPI